MLFNSIQFAIFFPVVTIAYFLLRHQYRWLLLLVASCYFYMAYIPKYILILFGLIIVDFVAAILIEKIQSTAGKRLILLASLLANVATLIVFKYFNFFNENLTSLARLIHWNYSVKALNFILPIGRSFHVFQSMAYTIEVYFGNVKAERHLGIYALYVMFYPQLMAGPIERPQHMLHQFRAKYSFDIDRISYGLRLMLRGFLKKLVVADRLAVVVNHVFERPQEYHGLPLIAASVFFIFQIYCDFSGYTDIARGAAKVMGFELMENFQRPFLSTSIPEYYRRWHVSLFSWFKDYLFNPIAFSGKKSIPRMYCSVAIVFVLSGLWHGANWTYVIWGALTAAYLICSLYTAPARKRVSRRIQSSRWAPLQSAGRIVVTFTLVTLSFVFIRAKNLDDGVYIVRNLFVGITLKWPATLGLSSRELVYCAVLVASVWIAQLTRETRPDYDLLGTLPAPLRWAVWYAGILAALLLGPQLTEQFIYFKF